MLFTNVISISLFFLMKSLGFRIYAFMLSLMLISLLPPSFLFMLSLLCTRLLIDINFLVLWYICLSSSLVHFKKCPEYFTKGTGQVFILLMKFLQQCLVFRYYFHIFSSSWLVWYIIFPSTCNFSSRVLIFSWFPFFIFFKFSLWTWQIFL